MLVLALLLPLLGLAAAAPTSSGFEILPRQANSTAAAAAAATTTKLTFTGAGASFSVDAPVNGQSFQIPNPISVDHIAQTGTANCQFKGVNGAQLAVLGASNAATLAPPQTVVSGTCQ